MRRRRNHVDPRVRRQLRVLRAGRVGVHQRAGAIEVLRVREQVKELRRGAGALGTREQAVDHAAFGIGRRTVGEGKQIDREQNVEILQRVARRLAEPMVERSASGAADLVEDAVEHLAPLLVLVEALIQEVAQEAPALGDAPSDREADAQHRILRGRVVLQEADEIASAGEADPDDARIGAAIDHVVDAARLESAVERDRAAVDEVPARSRDNLAPGGRIVADRHDVLGAVRVDRRIGLVRAIGDRCRGCALVEDEVAADDAGDPPAVFSGDRHFHPHRTGAFGYVPLPSHPEQREALAHERAVAELRFFCRVGRPGRLLKGLQQRLATAVADLIEQPAVAPAGIDRLQHVEIGARLDLAARVARRQLEVDNLAVSR